MTWFRLWPGPCCSVLPETCAEIFSGPSSRRCTDTVSDGSLPGRPSGDRVPGGRTGTRVRAVRNADDPREFRDGHAVPWGDSWRPDFMRGVFSSRIPLTQKAFFESGVTRTPSSMTSSIASVRPSRRARAEADRRPGAADRRPRPPLAPPLLPDRPPHLPEGHIRPVARRPQRAAGQAGTGHRPEDQGVDDPPDQMTAVVPCRRPRLSPGRAEHQGHELARARCG